MCSGPGSIYGNQDTIQSDMFCLVRTRATTMATPTPTRQGAPEPTIGAAPQGGAMARGRGRVTPLSADEVAREGDEWDDEQIHEKEAPPQPTPEMINQVLAYLSRLSDQGQAPQRFLH
ncbi:hypothetical protein H5410_000889 [Solanum commersonii]|uniref:Uncharacterized protein n=1 Tax=Solanum commersonii TaxID=4109 RepID=A0A9J6AXI6_SOLCO|nr:hypothetical protein H5410_000889 [Solanum commersonii]